MSPQAAIKEQLETLNIVFDRVSKSKQTAMEFLIRAGLLKDDNVGKAKDASGW